MQACTARKRKKYKSFRGVVKRLVLFQVKYTRYFLFRRVPSLNILREAGAQSAATVEADHWPRHLEVSSQSRSQKGSSGSGWWLEVRCSDAGSRTATSSSANGDPPECQQGQEQGEFSRWPEEWCTEGPVNGQGCAVLRLFISMAASTRSKCSQLQWRQWEAGWWASTGNGNPSQETSGYSGQSRKG